MKFTVMQLLICSSLSVLVSCRASLEPASELRREGAGVGNTAGYGRGWYQLAWFLEKNGTAVQNNKTVKYCVVGDNTKAYLSTINKSIKPWVSAVKKLYLNSPRDRYHFVTSFEQVIKCSDAQLEIRLAQKPTGVEATDGSGVYVLKNKKPVTDSNWSGGVVYISADYLDLKKSNKFYRAMLQSWGHVFGTREISGTVMGKDYLEGRRPGLEVSGMITPADVLAARVKGREGCKKTKDNELFARPLETPSDYCLYYAADEEVDDFDGSH